MSTASTSSTALSTAPKELEAAEQGEATGQYNLGQCYMYGRGVTKDYVAALMWANLAAVSGEEYAKKLGKLLERKMTAEQIAEAQRLSRDWKPRQHQGE